MTIEAALEENTKALLSVHEMLKITAVNQERLIAGQTAAIDKIEPEKRTRTKKETPATAAPKAETKPAPKPSDAREVSADQLKDIGLKFLTAAGEKGEAEKTDAIAFISDVSNELGTPKMNGPTSTLDATGRLKAAFYLERKGAGLNVDFGADYDFDGDPTQDGDDSDAGESGAATDEDF